MIQIRIATRVSDSGVGDIRWVLLESDPAIATDAELVAPMSAPEPSTPVAAAAAPAQPVGTVELPRSRVGHGLLRAAALVAALAAVGWIASTVIERSGAGASTVRATAR